MIHQHFKRLNGLIALGVGCSFVLTACASSNFPPVTSSEEASNSVERLPGESQTEVQTGAIASAERVVALTSLTADLAYQLDSRKLVGVPGSSLITGDSRFESIEIVSSERTPPNLESIVALDPDLVIGAVGFHESVAEQLKDAGISTLLTSVDSWDSLQELTAMLADILDADATALLQRYEICLADAPDEASPSTLVLVSYQPILSPNQNSWAGDFLKRFNIQNIMADIQDDASGSSPGQSFDGYVSLSAETILEANPDRVFVVNTQEDILQKFEANPFWNELNATQTGDVYVFDYYGLVNPGSLQSIDETCTRFSQLTSSNSGSP